MNGPRVHVRFEPKVGSAVEEYEDSAAYDEGTGLCVVSDGAGSSYRAARWSAALTESFILNPPSLDSRLTGFSEWVSRVADEFQASSESVSDASWYTSDASRRGSFATFVGVRLLPGAPMRLSGVHVGDACMFHCRGNQLVAATASDPDSFDATPDLLGSSPYKESYGAENAVYFESEVQAGDLVLLTSDALGCAMLRLAKAGNPQWESFSRLGPVGFRSVVARLRDDGIMENDDVTLLSLVAPGVGK